MMLLPLSSSRPAAIGVLGGKAASLIRLKQAGFPVPDGWVLTTEFFEPWIEAVVAGSPWQVVLKRLTASPVRLPGLAERAQLMYDCKAIQHTALDLPLSADQASCLSRLADTSNPGPWAVRSSSPHEDLAAASFAGLYESVLEVPTDALEKAVRRCFVSCLSARVLLYKREMALDDLTPAIAVIVQRQIRSDVAGVIFSMNPLTNDFDEALINAGWGAGEALVSGEITPDTLVVDKFRNLVLTRRAGEKGGDRSAEICLSERQAVELTDLAKRIEALYGEPVDVEWARVGDEVHLLQARPVTSYVPLPGALQTPPGAPRNLYMDGALTDGLTISGPISPLTLDTFEWIYRLLIEQMLGVQADRIDLLGNGLGFVGSRIYVNLSYFLHLAGGGETLARQAGTTNTLMAEIFRSADLDRYRPARPPEQFRLRRVIRVLPGVLWRARVFLPWLLAPLRPRRFQTLYELALVDFEAWLAEPVDPAEPFSRSVLDGYARVGLTALHSTGPALLYFIYAGTDRVKRLIDPSSPEQQNLAQALCRGYPDDQVVQMGHAMFDLAHSLPADEFRDLERLLGRISQRTAPAAFLDRWDRFMTEFGCRGPLEMELANPCYAEAPTLALQQIATIALAGDGFDPHQAQRRLIEERERAFEALMKQLPKRKRRRLRRAYRNIMAYSGSRELIKHHVMQVNERLRRKLLALAERLIATGRLDDRSQIFELTMAEVDRAMTDDAFDVRRAANHRGAPYRRLKARVRHFPMVIDSRGRILRPPPRHGDNRGLRGAGVSPGVARGPVKVLNDPLEKEVDPGDVIVAVTTDPGWTPLFINAAAVVLEIGGELQHGALVAREYGKPCVTGIADVTGRLQDGQRVEVNGNEGIVRIIER